MINLIYEYILHRLDKSYKNNSKTSSNGFRILPSMIVIITPIFIYLGFRIYNSFDPRAEDITKKQLIKLSSLLDKEKRDIGYYPKNLTDVIRNDPFKKGITDDYWGNPFFYKLTDGGKKYLLYSKGKDGVANTPDDIK